MNSGWFPLPVRGTQHFHEGRGDRGTLPARNTVEAYVPSQLEPCHRDAYQTLRRIDRSRQKADADIGIEQSQQILIRRNFMAMIGIEPLCTQHRGEITALLAMVPEQKTFRLEIFEADRLLTPETMRVSPPEIAERPFP